MAMNGEELLKRVMERQGPDRVRVRLASPDGSVREMDWREAVIHQLGSIDQHLFAIRGVLEREEAARVPGD